MADLEPKPAEDGIQLETITAILAEGGEAEATAKKLQAAFEDSIVRLKSNREDIKSEKTKLAERYHALEESSKANEAQIASLKEQLQKNSPEEAKKLFADERTRLENQYKGLLKDAEDKNVSLTAHVKELEAYKHEMDCEKEFDRVARDKKILPDSYADVKSWILGRNAEKFVLRAIGANDQRYLDSEGHTINNALDDFLKTSMGKKCVAFDSTGGGAGGGVGADGRKTMTMAEFRSLSPQRRAEVARTYNLVD